MPCINHTHLKGNDTKEVNKHIAISIFRDLDSEIKDEITKVESWLVTAEEGDAITLDSENCKHDRVIK